MTIQYKCIECGGIFDHKDIVEISYCEYSGATPQKEYVSPCCSADYEEIDIADDV